MAAKGPLPFPSAVKARRGTIRADREEPNQPKLRPAIPKCPDWLSPAATALYDDLGVTLCAAGLLTKADASSLARLCSYQALLYEHLKRLDIITSTQLTTGGEAASGRMKVVLALEEKVRNLEDRFGLNPAARSRISVPRDDSNATPNEAADFA